MFTGLTAAGSIGVPRENVTSIELLVFRFLGTLIAVMIRSQPPLS